MPNLQIQLYVKADGRTYGHEEILANAELRQRLELSSDPLGGLTITGNSSEVMLDDTIGMIARAFLYDAPPTLRDGKDFLYNLRLSHGQAGIALNDSHAIVYDDNNDQLTADRDELIAVLEAARATFEALIPVSA